MYVGICPIGNCAEHCIVLCCVVFHSIPHQQLLVNRQMSLLLPLGTLDTKHRNKLDFLL